MSDAPLSPGKGSSEFLVTLALIVGTVVLIAMDRIPTSVVEELVTLGMVYIGGRALPKTAQQVKSLGRNKQIDELIARALEKERAT